MDKNQGKGKGCRSGNRKGSGKAYAARQEQKGFQYGSDTVWQKEFEELFPYDETEDQLDAIDAVKTDMESPKIMDRLICGDVGYGKQKSPCGPRLRQYRTASRWSICPYYDFGPAALQYLCSEDERFSS